MTQFNPTHDTFQFTSGASAVRDSACPPAKNLPTPVRDEYPRLSRFLVFIAFFSISLFARAQVAPAAVASEPASSDTPSAANLSDVPETELWNAHGQFTFVAQKHASFTSPYAGPNSLQSDEGAKETVDGTLFLGLRLWRSGELYLNPEFDQGFGLSGTTGVAGFTSGAAYKVGHHSVYGRLQRAFLRQTFPLDDELSGVQSGANTLAGARPTNNLTLTLGKFSVVDVFDNNSYAHDPRADFLNWVVIDSAAFDYAADAWGYTYGMAAEWTQRDWTVRGGVFAMSSEPNAETIDQSFAQREWVLELEHRHQWGEHRGAIRLLAFVNQARMAYYGDAIALAQASGQPADVSSVRRSSSKSGYAINVEQELAEDLGAFARFSRNSGNTEAYDFTDVNQSLSAGFSAKGIYWNQPTHAFGTAFAVNALSQEAQAYFAAGGMGILIGDGQLPHYAREQILEAYYAVSLNKAMTVTGDFQYVRNPAYNADRGPVSIWGLRLHAEF